MWIVNAYSVRFAEDTKSRCQWSPRRINENLLVTFGYSKIEVENLNTLNDGFRFSFIGSDDLPGIAPDLLTTVGHAAVADRLGRHDLR